MIPATSIAEFVGAPRDGHPDRPWVMINMVASVDGATAIAGESRALSGPHDRDVFHALRGIADVILAGAQTVRSDRYGPMRPRDGVREARRARGQHPVAPIAVISRSLVFDWSSALFAEAEVPTILGAPSDCPPDALDAARRVARVIADRPGDVDVAQFLGRLRQMGHRGVLCEGGPRLIGELMAADLVDEIYVTISPLLVSGASDRAVVGPEFAPPRGLRLAGLMPIDDVVFLRYELMR